MPGLQVYRYRHDVEAFQGGDAVTALKANQSSQKFLFLQIHQY